MHTAHLPTVRVSVAATNCGQNSWHTLVKTFYLPQTSFVGGNKLNGTLFRFSAFESFLNFDCIQEALLHRGTTSLIGFITLWNYM